MNTTKILNSRLTDALARISGLTHHEIQDHAQRADKDATLKEFVEFIQSWEARPPQLIGFHSGPIRWYDLAPPGMRHPLDGGY